MRCLHLVKENAVLQLRRVADHAAFANENAPAHKRTGTQLRSLEAAVATLGVDFEEPFMVLSFITLSVIPRLRLTLEGVLDVQAQELVPVVVG